MVVKRPNPDYIARKLHHGVDQVSEQLIEVHNAIGDSLACVAHLVGYTDVARHDDYFGDSLNESYRVLVADRARGLPLVSDIRDKFKGGPHRPRSEPVRSPSLWSPIPRGAALLSTVSLWRWSPRRPFTKRGIFCWT